MAQKTIYRTIIELEILSDEPIEESMSLEQIQNECDDGGLLGRYTTTKANEPIKGTEAVKLVEELGSTADFFEMDQDGNDLEN